MNIHRLTSPQTMAVPMTMSGRMSHDDRQSSRALPRAIPNAQYDDTPGIPSMEAPSSIFRDIRDRLPKLPSPVEEDSTMRVDPPGSPLKSGISSLKERMGGFDSMDVDMDRNQASPENEVPSFAKIFGDSQITASPLKEEHSSEGPRTMHWRTHSSTNSLTNEGLQSEGSLQDAIKKSLSAYDDKLLRKLPSLTSPVSPSPASPARRNYHTLPRHFNPFSRASERDGPTPPKSSEFNVSGLFDPPKSSRGAIPSFNSPTTPSYKSPLNRWVNSGLPEASEPRSAGFAETSNKRPLLMDYRDSEDRSPNNLLNDGASVSSFADDLEREQHRRSGSMSLLGQYDDVSGTSSPRRSSLERKSPKAEGTEDELQMDDMAGSQLRRLTITSRTSPRGMSSPSLTSLASPSTFRPFEKRRATSPPPAEERYTMSGVELPRNRFLPDLPGNDLNRITMSGGRGFKSQSGPSMSSRYSGNHQQYASFSSSQSTTWSTFTNGDQASSVTSYSPSSEVGASPGVSGGSPYMHPSPKPPRSAATTYRGHARAQSDAVARQHASETAVGPKHHSAPKPFTAFLCECCPKKPKKFETQAELELHELEKQYTCAYCSHRFKNKNEAERHQNSLHLRKYSWSCAALSGVEAAFHPSPARPLLTDICGYCGEEFKNPADWDERTFHLTQVHKYGECNQHKKFYRADHFRQHLKHSHAGTSGKWANVLENACRREEVNPSSDSALQTHDSISEEAG